MMRDRSIQRKVLELKVRCSRNKDGCQWVGELRHLEREECGWAVVECSYQCGSYIPRRLIDTHQRDECLQRPIDVKLESFAQRIEKQLEREIKKMESKLTTEREQHEREMKKMETTMKGMETKLSAEKEEHEIEMKKFESKLTADREQHESEMKALEAKLTAKLATESERHEKELITLKEKIEKIMIEQALKEVIPQTGPQGALAGIPVEFVMTQYSTYKKLTNIPWYSPPFYTKPDGYKLCLRVDANGWGDGAGTHVSFHVLFMHAVYERHMISELTGMGSSCYETSAYYFTVQLVNHKSEQDPHEQTVQYILNKRNLEDSAEGHETNLGYGITQFISHDDLESSSESRLYVVNDCLTWRVSKVSCI